MRVPKHLEMSSSAAHAALIFRLDGTPSTSLRDFVV